MDMDNGKPFGFLVWEFAPILAPDVERGRERLPPDCGVVVIGDGSSATMVRNAIRRVGTTAEVVNPTVSGNKYSGPEFESIGILVFELSAWARNEERAGRPDTRSWAHEPVEAAPGRRIGREIQLAPIIFAERQDRFLGIADRPIGDDAFQFVVVP